MKILLPWSRISNYYYTRYIVGSKFQACNVATNGYIDGLNWWYSYYRFDDDTKDYCSFLHKEPITFQLAKNRCDVAMIKAGWKLLNENDKLLSLL